MAEFNSVNPNADIFTDTDRGADSSFVLQL